MNTWGEDFESFSRLFDLVNASLSGKITPADAAELDELVTRDAAARRLYLQIIDDSLNLRVWASGPDEAKSEVGKSKSEVGGRKSEDNPKPAKQTRPLNVPPAAAPAPSLYNPRSTFHISQLFLNPATFWSLLGFVVVGMLAIVYWSTRTHGPGTVATALAGPAATLVQATDAKWQDDIAPADNALTPGQRLKLTSGSVTIAFKSQARVIVDGPAEFTIVDATACRLSNGKLTAQVPEPAKGFKVHTPDGTVTDLGTEFGVFVSGPLSVVSGKQNSEPIADSRQPTASSTEVHVFKGKVDLMQDDQLAVAPPEPNSPPQSQIPNRKSQILTAGEAVTLSDNKVQPLPAADPFKFALDKLSGKPRTVLLAEDFEAYELGKADKAIGSWIVQSGTRKGQGVSVEDPAARIAAANATVDPSVRLPAPPTLVGSRVANFGTSPQNSTDTYPVLGREIDGKLLAKRCEVLVEFDFFPRSDEPQLSLALATEVGHTEGIELWRSIDAAKQGVDAAKKIEFVAYRWYRMRVLLSVADGVIGEVRVDRSQWRGAEGWVRDLSYQPPTPNLDWSTPPRYAIFGFPVVSPATVGGVFWLDNVRIEVISEN